MLVYGKNECVCHADVCLGRTTPVGGGLFDTPCIVLHIMCMLCL